jgi:hypothetical protein
MAKKKDKPKKAEKIDYICGWLSVIALFLMFVNFLRGYIMNPFLLIVLPLVWADTGYKALKENVRVDDVRRWFLSFISVIFIIVSLYSFLR